MKLIGKIIKYELSNVTRSKWIVFYSLFFLSVSYALFSFGGGGGKAILSLMNIVIIIIPLVSIMFGIMYFYNSREFIEMMLCQPIDRKSLFIGIFFGSVIPLSCSFLVGVALPFLFLGNIQEQIGLLLLLLAIGIFLTFIFLAVSFLIAVYNEDKVKALGFSILFWLVLSVLYDGLILFLVYFFKDYSLDKPIIAISLLNPVDLGRILFLLKFDISALMGYTGAVFQKFLGTTSGTVVSLITLLLWISIPSAAALRYFKRKDF